MNSGGREDKYYRARCNKCYFMNYLSVDEIFYSSDVHRRATQWFVCRNCRRTIVTRENAESIIPVRRIPREVWEKRLPIMGDDLDIMRIGITERGDPGRDFSWVSKLRRGKYNGAIIISKSWDIPELQYSISCTESKIPIIIHATVTGWGGTWMERNVSLSVNVLKSIRDMIDNGFPANRVVIRIDPIIPTAEGIDRLKTTLGLVELYLPDVTRIRVSIYDDYPGARAEMIYRGYPPIDSITKWKNEGERRPYAEHVHMIGDILINARKNQIYECCAEPELCAVYPDRFKAVGCVSNLDLELMGLPIDSDSKVNMQGRLGCRCLACKTELLSGRPKEPCENDCAYCYWRRI